MKSARPYFVLSLLALLCLALSPSLKADEWNKKTTVTFSGPVDVSGHRLEAGTYVFKLADTIDRHVVQIFSPDEKHVYATILAIPDYRVSPTDQTTIKFSEMADNVSTMDRDLPQAGIPIKEWFYPGDNFGQEFRVKPAPMVAEALPTAVAESTESAPSTPPPAAEKKADESSEAPAVEPAAVTPTESQATAPSAEQSSAQTPADQPASDKPAETPSQLPQTASSLPLVGLIGLVSLGVGMSLREVLKRTV